MIKKITFLLLITFISSNLLADTPYYINFKFILNQSDAGKKAQNYLKKKLENGIKNLNTKEKKIQDEEKKIIDKHTQNFFIAKSKKKNVLFLSY